MIEIYPRRESFVEAYWLGLACVGMAALFISGLVEEPLKVNADTATVFLLMMVSIALAGLFIWIGNRNRNARNNGEPIVVLTADGVRVRTLFAMRVVEFKWNEIDLIGATRKKNRTSLWMEGRFGKFGPYLHFEIDDDRPLDELNAELNRFSRSEAPVPY